MADSKHQNGNRGSARGTDAPWYRGWDLSDEERDRYRQLARDSFRRKRAAELGEGERSRHKVNQPKLDPKSLMPICERHDLTTLSLFSGGGGIDLGFDRAGFNHLASYEILQVAGETLSSNRPGWNIYSGAAGDVTETDWRRYRGAVDVIHGGPPCQPFSIAGRQRGKADTRDMLPEFVRAVLEILPQAFMGENVPGLKSPKFTSYLRSVFYGPLEKHYAIRTFTLKAESFGVPQRRERLIFLGFLDPNHATRFIPPDPAFDYSHLIGRDEGGNRSFDWPDTGLANGMGAREALGLPDIGFDALAPTLRSAFTGPRGTTSIVNSKGALKMWGRLEIWPNGVAASREAASRFPAKNGHFRLAVPDCKILQGFPEDWALEGPTFKQLGQIGNSVPPPLAYHVARSIFSALS